MVHLREQLHHPIEREFFRALGPLDRFDFIRPVEQAVRCRVPRREGDRVAA
jgi:hypothetical protein